MADGGNSITISQSRFDRAKAGEDSAVADVIAVLQVCVEEALRLLPSDPVLAEPDVRRCYVETGLRIACLDGFALLSDWRQALQGPFEVYATTTIQLYFMSLRSRGGAFQRDPTASTYWTPTMVVSALDRGGELNEELESLVIAAAFKAVAVVHRRVGRLGWAKSLEDLLHDVIKQIYETPGRRKAKQLDELGVAASRAYALRQWDPDRGLPLEAYVGFIAHRHAWRSCHRDAKRRDDPTEDIEKLSLRGSAQFPQLERHLDFERFMSSLSETDRTITLGKIHKKSAKEIAAGLGITPGNVDVRWSRIRARFKW